mmetsp:Transcript_5541/g.11278  ORF Transcript_5541/g.11278 Transcript_5541/m.11278 type:complete len:204 (+) Transcript_5541:165-776(+)
MVSGASCTMAEPLRIVVGVCVDSGAVLVHHPDVRRAGHRPVTALLWGDGRGGAAVGQRGSVPGRVLAGGVAPVRVRQPRAGGVAPRQGARPGLPHLELAGAVRGPQGGAVHLGLPVAGAAEHVELEGQGEAVHQAHVQPVAAGDLPRAGVARPPHGPEGGLELRVHRRGAAVARVAGLPRTAAVPYAARGAGVVAPQLRPVPR